MQYCVESIFVVEWLREYKSILKTSLAIESGGPGVQFDEKTRGRISRETVPLKHYYLIASTGVWISAYKST
jgi:hypothetical protein